MMKTAVTLTLMLLGTPANAWFDDGPDPRLIEQYTIEVLGGMDMQAGYEQQMRVMCRENKDVPSTPDWHLPCPEEWAR